MLLTSSFTSADCDVVTKDRTMYSTTLTGLIAMSTLSSLFSITYVVLFVSSHLIANSLIPPLVLQLSNTEVS